MDRYKIGNNLPDLNMNRRKFSNIQVIIRCRPLSRREMKRGDEEVVRIINKTMLVLVDPYDSGGGNSARRGKQSQFEFDHILDKTSSQQETFNTVARTILPGLFEGLNATIFAYGATAAGKTYTMLGSKENPGILKQSVNDLMNMFESEKYSRAVMRFSYIEVYNEILRDLLVADDQPIDIREDPEKGIIINGVSEVVTTSKREVNTMIKIGNRNRTKDRTLGNKASSRSHAIVLMHIEAVTQEGGVGEVNIAKFFVVDLAGSEKATNSKGRKYVEGANINKSLLALSNCINALAETYERGRGVYVPYRASKLTRLLKDSLGGNSRTVMIANVSPAASSYEDTINTLKYASRAKNIKVKTMRNVVIGEKDINEYTKIVDALKRENADLKQALQKVNESSVDNNPDGNNEDNSLVQAILQKLNQHFELETQFRKKLVDLDQKVFELDSEMKKPSENERDDDAILIKIQELSNQRDSMMNQQLAYNNQRKQLNMEIQNSGLPNIQMGFLMNVFFKRQTELEIISNKNLEEKTGKVIKYRDWVIKFLKQQAIMRDNIMTQQMVVLDSNEVRFGMNYDGLRKVNELPETLKSDGDFALPPLFPDRQRKKNYGSSPQFIKNKFKVRNSDSSLNFPNVRKKKFFGNRPIRGKRGRGRGRRYQPPGKYSSNTGRYSKPGRKPKRTNIFNKYRNNSVNKYYNGGSKFASYKNSSLKNARGKYYPRRGGGGYKGLRSRYSGSVASLRYNNRGGNKRPRLRSSSQKSLNFSENSRTRSTASYNNYRPYSKRYRGGRGRGGRASSGYRAGGQFNKSPYLKKKFEKAGLGQRGGRDRVRGDRIYSGYQRR